MLKRLFLLGCAVLNAANAFASEVFFNGEIPLVWQPIVIVSGGPGWVTPGQDQYIYPVNPPPTITYFTNNSPTGVLATGEIFFGLQRPINPSLGGQLGIGLAGATDAQATGVAAVNNIPNVWAYQYKVNHGRVELKGKLIGNSFNPVQPYVSGSFGVAFNNAHDYTPVSNLPVLFPAPWFASNTAVAFAWTLGIGIQGMISPHWQLGMGYQFADFGKSYLQGDSINYNQGLTLTHLYVSELQFSVGYVY